MIENRVAEAIAKRKMDKRDVTKLTGIDRHTLANIYKGNVKSISFKNLNKLCYALDCNTNDLFTYTPD